jgi:3-isopropylmalate/(R)-2-methylmalate dehydratase large subunit
MTTTASGVALTLAEKVWNDHVVRSADNEPDLLYIDSTWSTR